MHQQRLVGGLATLAVLLLTLLLTSTFFFENYTAEAVVLNGSASF